MTTPDKQKPSLSNLPDAEDDLDDLDDVLDQFSPSTGKQQPQSPGGLVSPPPPPPTATTTTTFGRPRTNTRVDVPPKSVPGGLGLAANDLDSTNELDEDELSAEFSRELAKGMESLMREISGGSLPTGSTSTNGEGGAEGSLDDEETARKFKAAWEAMLVEGMDGILGNDLGGLEEFLAGETKGDSGKEKEAATTANAGQEAPKNDFQEKIKQAMDRIRESESSHQANSSSLPGAGGADITPDALETMLKSLGSLGLGEDGLKNEDELVGLLENMMSQLMSKDILYEPLKEFADSFPGYLANPPAPLSAEDRTRYENQLACTHKVLELFHMPEYSDSNPEARKTVTDLMTELQSYGSPPPEVVGPLPTGMTLGPDGLPTGEGCIIA